MASILPDWWQEAITTARRHGRALDWHSRDGGYTFYAATWALDAGGFRNGPAEMIGNGSLTAAREWAQSLNTPAKAPQTAQDAPKVSTAPLTTRAPQKRSKRVAGQLELWGD